MSLLAAVRPTANTQTVIYTVPSNKKAIVNVTIMNVVATSGALVDFGIQSLAGAFASADYWLYQFPMPENGAPIQFTGIVLAAGNSIRANTSNGTVNFHVNGIVETA